MPTSTPEEEQAPTDPAELADWRACQIKRMMALTVRADALSATVTRLRERAEELRKLLTPTCPHAPEDVVDWEWIHNNGYGRSSQVIGERCRLCGSKKAWKGSSLWQTPEQYSASRSRDDD